MKRITPVAIIALVLGSAILLSGVAYEVAYRGRIYPGVKVESIVLSNLPPVKAEQILTQKLSANRRITLVWGTSRWEIPLTEFGLVYDSHETANRAFTVGRSQTPWKDLRVKIQAWKVGVSVSPVFSLDENRIMDAIASISAQINIPAKEPEVNVENNVVSISPGENGQAVDDRQLFQDIKKAVANPAISQIDIPVKKLEPRLTEVQSQALKQRAEKLVNKKITIRLDLQSWEIPANQILAWIDPTGGSTWKQNNIQQWIDELAQTANRLPENALFTYVGSGRVEQFKPAVDGLAIDQAQLLAKLTSTLSELEQNNEAQVGLDIPAVHTPPAITTAQVNSLGIKELVARGESNYTGSIPNRVFNLHKAASYMNGVLVAPGEEFSFNKHVGDISATGGYKPAYIIKEGRTVLGDGGGVCQVSTTMFRAALNAGLPITMRTAHAYRVHYYENDSQPGLDATIFTPSVDFRFKNDTPNYILIQTVFDDKNNKLAFEFYGTRDGRQVTISKPRVWDVAPPPPALYQDDPTLLTGVVKQVDFDAWGAKAAFDYKVTRGDEVLQKQTFYSNYRPWQAVFLRGTRTN